MSRMTAAFALVALAKPLKQYPCEVAARESSLRSLDSSLRSLDPLTILEDLLTILEDLPPILESLPPILENPLTILEDLPPPCCEPFCDTLSVGGCF